MMKSNRKPILISYVYLFLISAIFVYLLSFSTSPHYPMPYSGDSPFFLTIGKYWSKGMIPYIDLWDQKGPIIFFMNMLGWIITDSRSGVFLVQIVSLFITLIALQRFLRLKYSIMASAGLTAFFLAGLTYVYQWGNTVEEYLLPWMVIGLYYLYQWILKAESGDFYHDPKYAFFYGIVGAYCFWSRATNALPIFAGCIVVVVSLLIHKEYQNVTKNLLAAVAGFLCLSLPIIIYFASKNALPDLWYGTISFNMEYAKSSATNAPIGHFLLDDPLKYLVCYGYSLFLVIIGIYDLLVSRRILCGFFCIAVGILPAVWLVTSMGYPHYGMILSPLYPIIVLEMSEFKNVDRAKSKKTLLLYLPLSVMLLFHTFIFSYAIHDYQSSYLKDEPTKAYGLEKVFNMIPDEEKDDFVAYNGSGGTYLITDVQPLLPVFSFQDWYSSNSPSWGEHIHKMYDDANIKWVLTRGALDETCGIQDILDAKYMLICEEEVPTTGNIFYYLYRLK